MASNTNWFESPVPKASSFYGQALARLDQEQDPEESNPIRQSMMSNLMMAPPTPNANHDSPWSRMVNPMQELRMDRINLTNLIPEQSEPEGIN